MTQINHQFEQPAGWLSDRSHFSSSASELPASEAESLLWLNHQQSKDRPSQYAVAYRLSGVDTGRLIASLLQLFEQMPVLKTIYRFDAHHGVMKTIADGVSLPVVVEHVGSEEDGVNKLLKLQSTPFDLSKQPGIQFGVFTGPGWVLWGIVVHQLVGQLAGTGTFTQLAGTGTFTERDNLWGQALLQKDALKGTDTITGMILSKVAKLYRGDVFRGQATLCKESGEGILRGQAPEMSLSTSGLLLPEEPVSAGIPGFVRLSRVCSVSPGSTPLPGESDQLTVSLHLKHLAGLLKGSQGFRQAVLTVLAVQVARQISAFSGKEVVRVSVASEMAEGVDAWHGRLIGTGLRMLTFDCSINSFESLLSQAEEQMQAKGLAYAETAEEIPEALLFGLSDSVVDLGSVQVQQVLLPSLFPSFELTFAVGLSAQGEDTLTLTTTKNVSGYAAGWLLESLADSLTDGHTVGDAHLFAGVADAQSSLSEVPVPVKTPVSAQTNASVPVKEVFDANTPPVGTSSPEPDITFLILSAFREALSMPEMEEDDDFFDMGGHSLIATRVIGQLLHQHQIELQMNDLFRYPTARDLAGNAIVHHKASQDENIGFRGEEHSESDEHFPLSLAQRSMWNVVQKFISIGLPHVFNIPFTLHFPDGVDETALSQAFGDILLRHSGLRTHFSVSNGEPYQWVVPVSELGQYRWCWLSEETSPEPFRDALNREAGYGFDLATELPLRLRFIRDSHSGDLYLSMLFHHLVLDEWSVNLMMDELSQAYLTRSGGQAPQWRSEPLPFHRYAQIQSDRGMDIQHLNFWLEHLAGASWAQPIFDQDHPLHQPHDSQSDSEGGWVEFQLEPAVSDGLYQQAKNSNASLFNVVYSAIVASLHLLGEAKEMVIGTPVSGRLDAQFFDTIGYFTTIAVHRIHLEEQQTVDGLITQVKQTVNESMQYADIPVDVVEENLFGSDCNQPGHMFEVMIQLHARNKLHGCLTGADGTPSRFRQVDPEKHEAALGLQFEVMEEEVDGEPRIRVLMSYLAKHYSPAQVDLLQQTTAEMLDYFSRSQSGELSLASLRTHLIPLMASKAVS